MHVRFNALHCLTWKKQGLLLIPAMWEKQVCHKNRSAQLTKRIFLFFHQMLLLTWSCIQMHGRLIISLLRDTCYHFCVRIDDRDLSWMHKNLLLWRVKRSTPWMAGGLDLLIFFTARVCALVQLWLQGYVISHNKKGHHPECKGACSHAAKNTSIQTHHQVKEKQLENQHPSLAMASFFTGLLTRGNAWYNSDLHRGPGRRRSKN